MKMNQVAILRLTRVEFDVIWVILFGDDPWVDNERAAWGFCLLPHNRHIWRPVICDMFKVPRSIQYAVVVAEDDIREAFAEFPAPVEQIIAHEMAHVFSHHVLADTSENYADHIGGVFLRDAKFSDGLLKWNTFNREMLR